MSKNIYIYLWIIYFNLLPFTPLMPVQSAHAQEIASESATVATPSASLSSSSPATPSADLVLPLFATPSATATPSASPSPIPTTNPSPTPSPIIPSSPSPHPSNPPLLPPPVRHPQFTLRLKHKITSLPDLTPLVSLPARQLSAPIVPSLSKATTPLNLSTFSLKDPTANLSQIDITLNQAGLAADPVVSVALRHTGDPDKSDISLSPKGTTLLPDSPPTPGSYELVAITQSGQILSTESFQWGVLVLNTDKNSYHPSETATISIGALNNFGHTLCNANLSLSVTSPSGTTSLYQTADHSILNSPTCGADNVTDIADYSAQLPLPDSGFYHLTLTNLDTKYVIEDTIIVEQSSPFLIERSGATRINPFKSDYQMSLKITALADYHGKISDTLPSNFQVVKGQNSWDVDLQANTPQTFTYTYHAPPTSPAVFQLGPLKIAGYNDDYIWSLASDAACNVTASGTWSTTATFVGCTGAGGSPAAGDDLTINAGVTLTDDTTATVNSLTLANPTTANSITINTTRTLTVTNALTLSANSTGNAETVTLSGSGAINAGSIVINAPSSTGNNTITTTSSSATLTVSGTITITGNSTSTGISQITIGPGTVSAGGITLNGGTNATGVAQITSSTGNVTTTGGITFGGTTTNAKLSLTSTAHLNFQGTFPNSGTVTMNASSTLDIKGNTTINKSMTWGNVTLTAGTLTLGVATGLNGNWTNNSGATALTGNFIVTMGGTSKTIGGSALTPFFGLTIGNGASITLNTSCTVGAGNLIFATGATATSLTHASGIDLTITGAVTLNQPSAAVTKAWNINAGTATVSGAITIPSTSTTTTRIVSIVIGNGTLNANGGLNTTGATGGSTAAVHVINLSTGSGTLNLKGNISTVSVAGASGWTITSGLSSNFNYVDSVAQTIYLPGAGSYANLWVNNTSSSGATLDTTITTTNVKGNLLVGNTNSGSLFVSPGSSNITGNSFKTFSVATGSTFTMTGTATFPTGFTTTTLDAASTVNYQQTSTPLNITSTTYGNLGLLPAGTATYNLPAGTFTVAGDFTCGNGSNTTTCSADANSTTLDIGGNLTIASSSTFVANASNSFTLAGNFSNAGTFTHSSGTLTLDGADSSTQIISGSTTFSNLTAQTSSNSAGRTLEFTAGTTTTVSGTLTITGFSGKVITLQSSTTSAWTINPTAASVDYADISYSTNTGTSFCATHSTDSGHNTSWSINSGTSCSGNTAPDNPTSAAQKTTADVAITTGNWVSATSIKFTATATDTDATDTLELCIEVDDINTSFSNTEDSCGTGVSYSGSGVAVTNTISGLTDATQYHWQARIKDAAGAYSSWVSYGGNSDTTPGADRDFGLDTTAPSGGTVYDGSSTGVDASISTTSLSSLSANWSGISSGASGLSLYEYAIGTTAGGTDIKNWTSNSTTTSITDNSLTLDTSHLYYFSVRTTDSAGNVSTPISSNGQIVAPSLTFTVAPSSLVFSNLSPTNSYTNTQAATLTTTTNAYRGYVVRGYLTDLLRTTSGITTIPAFSAGSYATPSTWSGYGLGYTSDDTTIQGSDKFGSGTLYAPFASTAPGDIVADNTTSVSGTPINDTVTLTYKVAADATTQSSATYATTAVFTATALY